MSCNSGESNAGQSGGFCLRFMAPLELHLSFPTTSVAQAGARRRPKAQPDSVQMRRGEVARSFDDARQDGEDSARFRDGILTHVEPEELPCVPAVTAPCLS